MLRILLNEIPLYRRIIYWLITGVVFSLCFGAMLTTRDGSIHQFFDDGYVWDLKEVWRINNTVANIYNADTDTYTFPESGEFALSLGEPMEGWKYFYIDISGIEPDTIRAVTNAYDKDWNNIGRGGKSLVEGGNLFRVPVGEGIVNEYISFVSSTPNVEYKINDMMISEYAELSDYSKLIPHTLIGIVIFIALSIIVFFFFRTKNVSKEQTSNIYIDVSRLLYVKEVLFTNPRLVRTLSFTFLVLSWTLTLLFNIRKYYGFAVIAHIILFSVIIASIEKEKKSPIKLNAMHLLLIIFVILTFVSDIITPKVWGFVQIWFLLSFVPFGIALYLSKKPEEMLEDFLGAVDIFFFINIIYLMISENIYYAESSIDGIWDNRNFFGLNMAIVAVLMGFHVINEYEKKRWKVFIIRIILMMLSIYLTFRSDSRTSILSMASGVIFIIFFMLWKKFNSRILFYIIGMGMLITLVIIGWLFISGKMVFITNRVINNSTIDDISSGRIDIWIESIKHMNLLGHGDRIEYPYGDKVQSHNLYILLAYKYGVVVGLIGIAMAVESFFLIKDSKNVIENKYFLLICSVAIFYYVSGLTECMNEYPCDRLGTFAFYIVMCYMLAKNGVNKKNDFK